MTRRQVHLQIPVLCKDSLKAAERAVLVKALRLADGDVVGAAAILGIGASTMWRKISEQEITEQERGI